MFKINNVCFCFIFFFLIGAAGCTKTSVDTIKKRGYVVVITSNSAHGYYTNQGEPAGFQYELAKEYADFLGVDLKMITPDWDTMGSALKTETGDIIAATFTKNDYRESNYDFSDPYMMVQEQVIVNKDNHDIKSLADLAGKDIHIRAATAYEYSLKKLNANGHDFSIVTYENIPTEEFIRWVNEDSIDITVAASHIARLNQRYYPETKAAFPISEEEELCWAVKKGNKALVQSINTFFDTIEANHKFSRIYEKYYAGTDVFDYVDIKKFHKRLETRLPKYLPVIKSAASQGGLDWRLIAAVVYQESHYNPRAISHTGVRGLMQLTLVTAGEMGISNRLNPKQSVKGGVRYLAKQMERFDDIHEEDRMKFALAAYNVGYGHVRDAQEIAGKEGWDKTSWKGVSKALPLLRFSKYYKKTRYGYARGTEPVRYVNRIYTYYDIIKNKFDAVAEKDNTDDLTPDPDVKT